MCASGCLRGKGGVYFCALCNAGVAQLAEHLICNQKVAGSSPIASSSRQGGAAGERSLRRSCQRAEAGPRAVRGDPGRQGPEGTGPRPAHMNTGEVPEWPKGADCKSAGNAFGGSNPPLTTKDITRGGAEPKRRMNNKEVITQAHVAQQVEHFLGKEEVHRFKPDRGLQKV